MLTSSIGPPNSVAVCDNVLPASSLNPFAFPRSSDKTVKSARILIVDDDPSVVQVIKRKLEEAGFANCRGTSDPVRAVNCIPSAMPDLVLLDWRMQPTSGLEILQAVRGNAKTQHIPIIIVTSADDELTAVTALNQGATDFVSKPVRASELVARTRNVLSTKVYRDLATQRAIQLQSDLLSDSLTGIANRRAFEYELKRRMTEWTRRRTPLGLAMIDLDRFKQINDRYGHRVGDSVLRGVAQAITNATRSMDLVARYGGEEIAIILPSTPFNETKEVVERARKLVADARFSVEGHELRITVSCGIATAMNGDDANLFVRRADTALYAAKAGGRNCVFFHGGAKCHPISDLARTAQAQPNNADSSPAGERLPSTAKVAIVDDEPTIILMVKKYLQREGIHNVIEIDTARDAVATIERETPDLVLLDVHMPEVSGLEILERLRTTEVTQDIPVLIVTSDQKSDAKIEALRLGASDFLQKPIEPSELLARVRNTLLAKSRMDDLADYSQRLEHEVQLRTTELSASRREAIQCLARAAELRDDHTGRHVMRVGRYAAIIAEEMGFDDERVVWMELAAQLHDVGKIGVPDSILNKPGKLDDEEFEVMKGHCGNGTRIIRDQAEGPASSPNCHTQTSIGVFDDCNSPIMRMAATVANTHHEKWDGSGYPRGLAGNEIPIEGRITAVADVFDALSTKRPYKEAIDLEECFRMIQEGSGVHFDADVVQAFLARKSAVTRIFHDYAG